MQTAHPDWKPTPYWWGQGPAPTTDPYLARGLVPVTMMRALLLLSLLLPLPAHAADRRCGWLENPTPGNWFLRDRDAEWILSLQGGPGADGMDDMPDMTKHGWVETNVHYGHGCACLTVEVDKPAKRIVRVTAATPLPLSRCRADHTLPRP